MKKLLLMIALLFPFLVIILPSPAQSLTLAEDISLANEDCLFCHSKKDFQVERGGLTISLYIDPEQFHNSIHGTNHCTSCHPNVPSIPHKNALHGPEQKNLINQRCQACHQDIASDYLEGVHNREESSSQPAASCSDCHGSHNIRKKEDPQSAVFKTNIPHTCTKCHQGEVAEAYEESFHGKAVYLGSAKAATCADCHGSHKIIGPGESGSPVAKVGIPGTCAKCHQVPRENFAKGIEHFVLEKKPGSAPMYYTLKFFTWLTIICITALFVHMELELFRRYREIKKG